MTTLIQKHQVLIKSILSNFDPSVTMLVMHIAHRIITVNEDKLLGLCPLSRCTDRWNIMRGNNTATPFTLITFLIKQVYDTEYVDASIAQQEV